MTPAQLIYLFGSARPVGDIDFTTGKYRLGTQATSDFLTLPGASFSRASTGTAISSIGQVVSFASGQPRVTDLGLLIEDARTNSALWSQDLTNAQWGPSTSGLGTITATTANFAAAPDGTLTASRFQLSLGGGVTTSDFAFKSQALLASTDVAGSMYLKNNGAGTVNVYFRVHNTEQTVAVGQSWVRVAGLALSSDASSIFAIGLRGGQATANTNTVDLLVWGAQLEAGPFPSSYIFTTSASATRAADIPLLSGVTNPTAAFYQTYGVAGGTLPRLFQYDGGANAYFLSSTVIELTNNTVTLDGTVGGAGTQSGVVKTALGFDASGMTVVANGGTKAINAIAWAANTGNLTLGNNSSGTRPLNGYLQRVLLGTTKGQFDRMTQ